MRRFLGLLLDKSNVGFTDLISYENKTVRISIARHDDITETAEPAYLA